MIWNLTVPNTDATDIDADNTGKNLIFKNCVSFTECISEINKIQTDNTKNLDGIMPIHNLIEYSNN